MRTTRGTGQMATREANAGHLDGSGGDRGTPPSEASGLNDLLRSLPGMRRIVERIRNLAELDVPILIEGEPGTGVEFVAQEIHVLSHRRDQPFVSIPCVAVPELTLATQLWGYGRGFTATTTEDHPGLLESADGGTVFFDEIRDVPHNLQVRLTRMMKTHEITRLGQSQSRRVNVRVICATKFNLMQEAAEGHFLADLLYLIRVAQIRVPPLRERAVDVPPLIAFFLAQSRRLPDKPSASLSDEAMRMLLAYSWPGNIAELQSAIEFAALSCTGRTIASGDLPLEIRAFGTKVTLPVSPEQTEKDRFLAAIGAASGNRTRAARMLGISRATLYRRLKDLGIPTRN